VNIGIIMDGNGRWATKQGKKRTEGHRVGSEVVRDLTTFASKKTEISSLTLYAFSTENWKRPKLEVDFLMKLLSTYLNRELPTYLENGVKFRAIGDLTPFSKNLRKSIENLEKETEKMSELTQNLAINYGGKDEIVRSIKEVLKNSDEVNEKNIQKNLDLKENIDILIRTGGEKRVSNFLLWQIAYAELFFTDTLFPDFNQNELEQIVLDFKNRERRFGGL
jgi:undecaprenyl diphosphate synthase